MTINRKKWEEKQLYGHFKQLISNISHEKTWTWLRKGNLKEKNRISSNSSTKQHHKNQLGGQGDPLGTVQEVGV